MPATYEPIATTTLGSAAASITFSSIPATYTDLRVVFVGKLTNSLDDFYIKYNSSTTTLYSHTGLYGNGSSAVSYASNTNARISINNYSSTQAQFLNLDLFSYTNSTNKTTLIEQSGDYNGAGLVNRMVALYRSTSVINAIQIGAFSSTLAAGATATLYGIKSA